MTPIDSLYEYAGLRLAAQLMSLSSGVGLPLILGLAGMAYVVHASLERGTMRDALIHLFYLIAMSWLLGSTEIPVRAGAATIRGRLDLEEHQADSVRVPRFVAYLGSGTDLLQRRAIEGVHREFLTGPFERERLQAAVDAADVFDGALKDDLWQFSRHCWRRAVALDRRSNAEIARLDPLTAGAFSYRDVGETTVSKENEPHIRHPLECETARQWLEIRVDRHLSYEPFHRKVLQSLTSIVTAKQLSIPVEKQYRAAVVRRAMLGSRNASGERLTLSLALPDQDRLDRAKRIRAIEDDRQWEFLNIGLSWIVDATARAGQSMDNAYTTRQKLYLVVLQGPYVYGLALMIVTGLFPIVGLFALLPGRWRALVNYGKVFLSIKLWPVCWAALTRFNARASELDVFGDGIRSSDLLTAVASMYLVTPALCFAVVSLATSVSALPFQQAFSQPAGVTVGPAVSAVRAVVSRR